MSTHGADPRLADTTSFALIGRGRLLQRRLEEALADEGVTLRDLGALGHLKAGQGHHDPAGAIAERRCEAVRRRRGG